MTIKLTYNQQTEFMERVIYGNFNNADSFFNDAIDWITETYEPEDIFSVKRLEAWAEQNDYVKKEE